MPIYEFYCEQCNTIFNFFSKSINTSKQPICPKCGAERLKRIMSPFSTISGRVGEDSMDSLPIDEEKAGKAMEILAKEAQNINEEDPKQAAGLMRKLFEMTGLKMGEGIEDAIERIESGEDPEKVEEEMGDILEEEPFIEKGKNIKSRQIDSPLRDETLYEL